MGNCHEIVKGLKKQYGESVATTGLNVYSNTQRVPTGIFPFDLACVVKGSLIQDSFNGRRCRIDTVVDSKLKLSVVSANNFNYSVGVITNWFNKGEQECLTIKTKHSISTVAKDHVFLTKRGWVKAKDLVLGDGVVSPLTYSIKFGDSKMCPHLLRFLGYWLADGNGTGDGSPDVSKGSGNQAMVDDLLIIAKSRGYTLTVDGINHSFVGAYQVLNWKGQYIETNIFRGFLKDMGVWGKTAKDKFIPDYIFTLRRYQVALFLASLWTGDGTVHPYRKSASYATASETLAYQVQYLLMRLGIHAYILVVPGKVTVMPSGLSSNCLPSYRVCVTGDTNIRKMFLEVPIIGHKGQLLKGHAEKVDSNRESYAVRNRIGSNSYLDRVVSINNAGVNPVYDVTVEPHHNLVIDGLVGHNSGGGFPMGRVSIIWGNESCLDESTILNVTTYTGGKRHTAKRTTIKRLFERFNGVKVPGKGQYLRKESLQADYTLPCMNDDGYIFSNNVVGVVYTGRRVCFKVVTKSGQTIEATEDHRFYIGDRYVSLKELVVGCTVFIHDNTPYTGRIAPRRNYEEVHVANHPVAGRKVVTDGKSGKAYTYHRLRKSRAVVEAAINCLEYEGYIELLNNGDIAGLKFLTRDEHVHHIDENIFNNDLGNLEITSSSDHGRKHALERHNNLRFIAREDEIISISSVGVRHTYDVKMESPYNNFIAQGFIVHNSGKTNLILKAIAKGQLVYPDKVAVFVDAEHGYDPLWAATLGVDNSRIWVLHPESAEQAATFMETFAYASDVFLLGLDSIAALAPQNEIESAIEKAAVGGASAIIGKVVRKLTISFIKMSNSGELPPAVILINQVRHKIGVMFGCLQGDCLVNFADGRRIPISKVVKEKIQGNVWSYNEKLGIMEGRAITAWHNNGLTDIDNDWVHIDTTSLDSKNGFSSITVTREHKLLTDKGWVEAKDISTDTKLVARQTNIINGTLREFLYGCVIGDCSIPNNINNRKVRRLVLQDSKNVDYVEWKVALLSKAYLFKKQNVTKGRFKYSSNATSEICQLSELIPNRNPVALMDNPIADLTLAIWIMDDGHFDCSTSHCRYSLSIKRLKDTNSLGLVSEWLDYSGYANAINLKNGSISFNVEVTNIIASRIGKYVPECMQYKLPLEYRDKYVPFELDYTPTPSIGFVDILNIRNASSRQMRTRSKYDLSIEGTKNYVAGGNSGVVVHNSPETMPGGNAIRFAAALIIRIYGKNKMDVKVHAVLPAYKETNITITKWKVPIIGVAAIYDMLMVPNGDQKPGYVYDWPTLRKFLTELDYLSKDGKTGWLLFGEKYKTQEAAKQALYGDPAILAEAQAQIILDCLEKEGGGLTDVILTDEDET